MIIYRREAASCHMVRGPEFGGLERVFGDSTVTSLHTRLQEITDFAKKGFR